MSFIYAINLSSSSFSLILNTAYIFSVFDLPDICQYRIRKINYNIEIVFFTNKIIKQDEENLWKFFLIVKVLPPYQ